MCFNVTGVGDVIFQRGFPSIFHFVVFIFKFFTKVGYETEVEIFGGGVQRGSEVLRGWNGDLFALC